MERQDKTQAKILLKAASSSNEKEMVEAIEDIAAQKLLGHDRTKSIVTQLIEHIKSNLHQSTHARNYPLALKYANQYVKTLEDNKKLLANDPVIANDYRINLFISHLLRSTLYLICEQKDEHINSAINDLKYLESLSNDPSSVLSLFVEAVFIEDDLKNMSEVKQLTCVKTNIKIGLAVEKLLNEKKANEEHYVSLYQKLYKAYLYCNKKNKADEILLKASSYIYTDEKKVEFKRNAQREIKEIKSVNEALYIAKKAEFLKDNALFFSKTKKAILEKDCWRAITDLNYLLKIIKEESWVKNNTSLSNLRMIYLLRSKLYILLDPRNSEYLQQATHDLKAFLDLSISKEEALNEFATEIFHHGSQGESDEEFFRKRIDICIALENILVQQNASAGLHLMVSHNLCLAYLYCNKEKEANDIVSATLNCFSDDDAKIIFQEKLVSHLISPDPEKAIPPLILQKIAPMLLRIILAQDCHAKSMVSAYYILLGQHQLRQLEKPVLKNIALMFQTAFSLSPKKVDSLYEEIINKMINSPTFRQPMAEKLITVFELIKPTNSKMIGKLREYLKDKFPREIKKITMCDDSRHEQETSCAKLQIIDEINALRCLTEQKIDNLNTISFDIPCVDEFKEPELMKRTIENQIKQFKKTTYDLGVDIKNISHNLQACLKQLNEHMTKIPADIDQSVFNNLQTMTSFQNRFEAHVGNLQALKSIAFKNAELITASCRFVKDKSNKIRSKGEESINEIKKTYLWVKKINIEKLLKDATRHHDLAIHILKKTCSMINNIEILEKAYHTFVDGILKSISELEIEILLKDMPEQYITLKSIPEGPILAILIRNQRSLKIEIDNLQQDFNKVINIKQSLGQVQECAKKTVTDHMIKQSKSILSDAKTGYQTIKANFKKNVDQQLKLDNINLQDVLMWLEKNKAETITQLKEHTKVISSKLDACLRALVRSPSLEKLVESKIEEITKKITLIEKTIIKEIEVFSTHTAATCSDIEKKAKAAMEKEQINTEKRLKKEQREKERKALENERLENERLEKERLEKWRRENERLDKERRENKIMKMYGKNNHKFLKYRIVSKSVPTVTDFDQKHELNQVKSFYDHLKALKKDTGLDYVQSLQTTLKEKIILKGGVVLFGGLYNSPDIAASVGLKDIDGTIFTKSNEACEHLVRQLVQEAGFMIRDFRDPKFKNLVKNVDGTEIDLTIAAPGYEGNQIISPLASDMTGLILNEEEFKSATDKYECIQEINDNYIICIDTSSSCYKDFKLACEGKLEGYIPYDPNRHLNYCNLILKCHRKAILIKGDNKYQAPHAPYLSFSMALTHLEEQFLRLLDSKNSDDQKKPDKEIRRVLKENNGINAETRPFLTVYLRAIIRHQNIQHGNFFKDKEYIAEIVRKILSELQRRRKITQGPVTIEWVKQIADELFLSKINQYKPQSDYQHPCSPVIYPIQGPVRFSSSSVTVPPMHRASAPGYQLSPDQACSLPFQGKKMQPESSSPSKKTKLASHSFLNTRTKVYTSKTLSHKAYERAQPYCSFQK